MAENFVAGIFNLQQELASSGESSSDDNFDDELDTFTLNSSSKESENNDGDDEGSSTVPSQDTSSNLKWSWSQSELSLQHFSFFGNSGIQLSLDENSSALDIFQYFVSPELLENIKSEINLYATQHPESLNSNRHDVPFNSTSTEELKVFLACSIMMNVIKLPEIHLYWSTDGMIDVLFSKKQYQEIGI